MWWQAACPKAKIVVMSPPPVDEAQWQATASKMTAGRLSGKERSAARTIEYAKALETVVKEDGAAWFDLIYMMR